MLPWLEPGIPAFPPTVWALDEPNGLLAAGGELNADWLQQAYPKGIFPWFNEGEPILWWSPSPRCVLFPNRFHLSKSLRKRMRQLNYEIRVDTCFTEVMQACAAPRASQDGTWISPSFILAYSELARRGVGHSIELFVDDRLVGGLYGLAIGRVFFGESMFSRIPDASKICLYHLAEILHQAGYAVIDCQIYNPHLHSLGAQEIDRAEFERLLTSCNQTPSADVWRNKHWSN
jgi:leucyl/phenylalanyl-tRNA--protein transferase